MLLHKNLRLQIIHFFVFNQHKKQNVFSYKYFYFDLKTFSIEVQRGISLENNTDISWKQM